MLNGIFSIYDTKAKAHLPPFFLPNSDMAIRMFSDCVNDPKHAFSAHPADYTLFFHGQFENTDGTFQYIEKDAIVNGVEVIQNPDAKHYAQLDLLENIPPNSKPQAVAK